MSGVSRPMSQMRKLETKEALFRTRKRILKYLVLDFLKQEGLHHTADALVSEAAITNEYTLCDNIDLDIMLQDYCSYYLLRFNKQPQFCRKVEEQPVKRPQTRRTRPEPVVMEKELSEPDLPATFTVTKLLKETELGNSVLPSMERKPLAGFLSSITSEKKQLVELLYQDIIKPTGACWNDIKGLATAKSILMESVVYPVRYPEVFTGLLEPWRGVLLHGPPGTGKTMLARAVASESGCTFFNITCSTVVNKWRGESEKLVKVLFEMASYYAPSIIFIDEVETLASERGAGEHEASRRLKSQLLIELDGITHRDGVVFLLVNSNMPWEIDPAMIRRLEKRIYIPLPDFKTREELFETFLNSKNIELVPKVNVEELSAKTEGYSGSDIKLVCKEALMSSVRKMLPNMRGKISKSSVLSYDYATEIMKNLYSDQSAIWNIFLYIDISNRRDKISLSDILTAIEKTKPVSKNLSKRHEDWQNEMGSS